MLIIFNSTYLVFYEKNCQTPLSKVNIYLYIHICISINLRFFIMGPKRYHVAKSVFNKMLLIFSSTYLVFYEKNCQTPFLLVCKKTCKIGGSLANLFGQPSWIYIYLCKKHILKISELYKKCNDFVVFWTNSLYYKSLILLVVRYVLFI